MNSPPDVELARLLRDLFAADELHRFLRIHYRDIADELPTNVGVIPLASAAAEALARHNLIDDALFARLQASRTRCARQIALTARVCRGAAGSRTPRRLLWLGLFAGALGVASAAALTLDRVPASSNDANCGEGRCGEQEQGLAHAVHEVGPHMPTNEGGGCPEGMLPLANLKSRPLCLDRTEVTRGAFCLSTTARKSILSRQDLDRCTPDPAVTRWSEHPIAMVRPNEAEAFCAERGLRLPQRTEFVQILVDELRGRPLESLLLAMNICDADYHKNGAADFPFTHHDGYEKTSPSGTYHEVFASPTGLDDMFGNVREIVLDGTQAFACGSSYLSYQVEDLEPEHCLSPQNKALAAGQRKPTLGFRCAGEPGAVLLRSLTAPVEN